MEGRKQVVAKGEDAVERTFGDRFRSTRILKRSHGITTYRGLDTRGGEVIIKTVAADRLAPTASARLEYEVAVLSKEGSELEGPIYTDTDDNLIFVVRPFVAGLTLEERLAQEPLSAPETVQLGVALLRALARAHTHGVMHGVVKPSNVVLREGLAERARLVDFEIARHPSMSDTLSRLSPKAAQYMSPEQSGSISVPVDARSDLYSVGVTLYEALAGKPPFAGETVGEVLRQHLTARPTPLATLVPGVPRGLDQIIERLLRKDPRDRYQTAPGALADFEELAAALEAGARDPEIVVGHADRRSELTEPVFIGRSAELNVLESALFQTRGGDGGLVLVEGESGRGKTWLLAELGRRATSLGARVLHGHGLDRVAPRPYHVLAEVVRELIARAQLHPGWGQTIAERLGSRSAAACASLPELHAILPEERAYSSLGPEEHGEARTMAALTALIDAIGTSEQPVVVLIDDAQWIDESSMRLFGHWQAQAPEGGKRHVTVAVAFRPEDLTGDHLLRSVGSLHHLRLSEFGSEEVREQIASMAGHLPEDAIQAVLHYAGGNPFLVSATLHGMVEAGALTHGASGWRINPSKLAQLQTAEHAAQLLSLRLTRLTGPQRRLLSVAALLGRTFDPVLAGALAGIDPNESLKIAEGRRGTLLWAGDSGTSFSFVHDKIREALLDDLSDDERRDLHRQAADHIEADTPENVFELAYHLDAAGDTTRALPFALEAAERARARFALELAESYYRIAARGAANADQKTQFAIQRGLGDMLTLRNRYEQAVDHYTTALRLAHTRREMADVEKRRSQLEMKRGDMLAACEHAEGALRLLGYRVPRNKLFLNSWMLWEVLIQVLHSYFPRQFVRERRGEKDEDELFAIDIYHGLNGPYFFSRGMDWALWAHMRLINLAERHPGTRALGRAYAAHAVCLSGFPRLYRRGLRISGAGAELCEQLGDLWGQAQGTTFHAMMLYVSGRFDEAIEVGRKGSELFDRTGDRWEATHGLDMAVDSLVRKGDLAGAVSQAQEIWKRGLEIDDSHALAWSLDAWSRATDGKVSAEMVDLARKRARDLQTSLAVAQADGVRLIGEGKLDEAVKVLEEAIERNEREAGYFFELNSHLLTFLITALRMKAERVSPYTPNERTRLVERAGSVAKKALSVTRTHRFSRPHALRECALLAAMEGKGNVARMRIDESVALAEELGEAYELAQSRLVRAELGCELGWAGAEQSLAGAREEVAMFRAAARSVEPPSERPESERETLSLVDRFATLLESGRAIATALTPAAIYSQTRRAALLLLRAERCAVLERSSEAAELVPVHGDVGMAFSQDVIRSAFEQGRALALSEEEALEDLTSRRAAARSVLCVPIRIRGEGKACLYLTHGEIGDLFGEDEQRIGDFLGTLAGAALENAEGFARLQSLSRELEDRVKERTRQLARANQDLETSLRQVKETQQQLIQAGKMAALGTLVAGLSHELNNPLTVVLGYVQVLLRQTAEKDSAHAPLSAIERQTRRCSNLVRALLEFSRREPVDRLPTSPASLCDTVCELVGATAREREVKLRESLPEIPLPDLLVSPQQIESALLNLLSNALDVTPAGGAVELEAHAAERGGVAGVLFSVTDSGPGIPADVLPRIFDPFFTTKPLGEGTGLGLSIAHQIVTAHGGEIDVETAEGKGTTLSVWIPVDGGPAQRSGEPAAASSPG